MHLGRVLILNLAHWAAYTRVGTLAWAHWAEHSRRLLEPLVPFRTLCGHGTVFVSQLLAAEITSCGSCLEIPYFIASGNDSLPPHTHTLSKRLSFPDGTISFQSKWQCSSKNLDHFTRGILVPIWCKPRSGVHRIKPNPQSIISIISYGFIFTLNFHIKWVGVGATMVIFLRLHCLLTGLLQGR